MRGIICFAVACAVALGACASRDQRDGISSLPARGPDGSKNWFIVSCHRSAHEGAVPFEGCVDEAGKICPSGYETASEHPHDMLIKCKRRPNLAKPEPEEKPEPPAKK